MPAKNITQFNALRRGSAVLVKNAAGCLYVGEVLDILKKVDKRYASIDESVDRKGVVYLSLQVYLPLCHNGSSVSDFVLCLHTSSLEGRMKMKKMNSTKMILTN